MVNNAGISHLSRLDELYTMEIRDWLIENTKNGEVEISQIPFESEKFDVMAVRRWREKLLASVLRRS